jgi:hypothetical protein
MESLEGKEGILLQLIKRRDSLERIRSTYKLLRTRNVIEDIPRKIRFLYKKADLLVEYYKTTNIETETLDSLPFKETLDILGVKYE